MTGVGALVVTRIETLVVGENVT